WTGTASRLPQAARPRRPHPAPAESRLGRLLWVEQLAHQTAVRARYLVDQLPEICGSAILHRRAELLQRLPEAVGLGGGAAGIVQARGHLLRHPLRGDDAAPPRRDHVVALFGGRRDVREGPVPLVVEYGDRLDPLVRGRV